MNKIVLRQSFKWKRRSILNQKKSVFLDFIWARTLNIGVDMICSITSAIRQIGKYQLSTLCFLDDQGNIMLVQTEAKKR